MELPDQLWPGDRVRVNEQEMIVSEAKPTTIYNGVELDGFVRGFTDTEEKIFSLKAFLLGQIESFEVIARPDVRFTDSPRRGDWFWLWYAEEAEPYLYMFWDLAGPFKDGTYSMKELSIWDVWRNRNRSALLLSRVCGWTNYIKKENGLLAWGGVPVPFFSLPYIPASLSMDRSKLQHQLRLF